jgi:hypothetical protein
MYIKILDRYRYKVGIRNLLSSQQRKMSIENYGAVLSYIISKRCLYLDRRDTSYISFKESDNGISKRRGSMRNIENCNVNGSVKDIKEVFVY